MVQSMMRLAIVLLVLFSGSAFAQTFMRQSMGRRNLQAAPASAPSTPLTALCEEPEYISTMTTSMEIFDQLTVPEYMNVAEYMVSFVTSFVPLCLCILHMMWHSLARQNQHCIAL